MVVDDQKKKNLLFIINYCQFGFLGKLFSGGILKEIEALPWAETGQIDCLGRVGATLE
jgi:hypothetical protein